METNKIKIPLAGNGIPAVIIIENMEGINKIQYEDHEYKSKLEKYTNELFRCLSRSIPRQMYFELTLKMIKTLRDNSQRGEFEEIKKILFTDDL